MRLTFAVRGRREWAVGAFRSAYDAGPHERLDPLHVEVVPSREAAERRATDVRAEIEAGWFQRQSR